MDEKEIDLETRLMMAEISLQVADSMIKNLDRKLNSLIKQIRNN